MIIIDLVSVQPPFQIRGNDLDGASATFFTRCAVLALVTL